jgi:hypothetical protein
MDSDSNKVIDCDGKRPQDREEKARSLSGCRVVEKCDCGEVDTDSDSNKVPDCVDESPLRPCK